MSRIATSNTEDFIKGKILDYAVDKRANYSRIFYHGIVINNEDPLNANRIKVRIPMIDENFYVDRTKEEGDALLPWCLPMSRNFIGTPETNSIVVVAIMDPKVPYFGRLYLDSMTMLSQENLFKPSRLVAEVGTYDNWNNFEKAINTTFKNKPVKAKEYNVKENVKYDIGIRGKGNNKILLSKEQVSINQNENDSRKHSLLVFTENIKMEAANELEILSRKGGKKYHPLFDAPVYDYIMEMNELLRQIILMLNSKPSLNSINMQPNFPSPMAAKLIPKLQNMYSKFRALKQPGNGASKYISIN